MLNRPSLILIITLVLGLFPARPGIAARFPNAVEREVVATGPQAAVLAELFGLSRSGGSVSLPLGRGERWAVYLLKQDTPEPLSNDNNGSPARYNLLIYTAEPVPALVISPYWLDLATRHPDSQPGSYCFASPDIFEDARDAEQAAAERPWRELLERLKAKSGWTERERRQFKECFAFDSGRSLCLEVFRVEDYSGTGRPPGHVLRLTWH